MARQATLGASRQIILSKPSSASCLEMAPGMASYDNSLARTRVDFTSSRATVAFWAQSLDW